jgi:hypothetical protein
VANRLYDWEAPKSFSKKRTAKVENGEVDEEKTRKKKKSHETTPHERVPLIKFMGFKSLFYDILCCPC